MSHYNTRYCSTHGEWDDVTRRGSCPKCPVCPACKGSGVALVEQERPAPASEDTGDALQFCDVTTDKRGRITYEFDSHGLDAFRAAIVRAARRPAALEGK